MQALIFKDEVLPNEKTLDDCSIQDNSKLLIFRSEVAEEIVKLCSDPGRADAGAAVSGNGAGGAAGAAAGAEE